MRIAILKSGMTSHSGSHDITVNDHIIARIIASYDPTHHEAPVFIGDGGNTAPSVGWVASLSRNGNVVYAETVQMHGGVEKDLIDGRRRVRRIGFYPDYGLRHISLTGEPILLPGLPHSFRGHERYYEFEYGGEHMEPMDDPRMKAFLRLGDEIYCGSPSKQFSENDNPGEMLHRKAMDILTSPSFAENDGRKIAGSSGYAGAFQMACEQNPDLAARYINMIEDIRYRNMKPTLSR